MAYKMKGPYHYGAYKKVKPCGRSVYKKDYGALTQEQRDNMKAYNNRGSKREEVARIEPKKAKGNIKPTNSFGGDIIKATEPRKQATTTKKQALVNKVRNAFRPGAGASKDLAQIKGLIKGMAGDGSKRRANEARRAKKANRSVTGRMKAKANRFRRPGDPR